VVFAASSHAGARLRLVPALVARPYIRAVSRGPTRFRPMDVVVLAAAAFLLVQAPLSVVEAGWVANLGPLPRLALSGLLAGYLLERTRVPGPLGLLLGAVLG